MSIIQKKRKSCSIECGDCKHFRRTRKFEDTCKNLGVLEKAKAPSCYEPDITAIRRINNLENVEELGKLTKDFSKKQRRILTHLLMRQNKIEELDLYFGQPMYVCLGSDYLSHYYKCYVVDVDLEENYVYVLSKLKDSKKGTSLYIPRNSLLTHEEFKQKALKLIRKDKIVFDVSEIGHFRNLPLSDQIGEDGKVDVKALMRDDLTLDVPTIDKAPVSKEKTKKKKRVKDLSETYEQASNGVIIRRLNTKG